jgi:hypothetical protein
VGTGGDAVQVGEGMNLEFQGKPGITCKEVLEVCDREISYQGVI